VGRVGDKRFVVEPLGKRSLGQDREWLAGVRTVRGIVGRTDGIDDRLAPRELALLEG
jgi:hypothetical protein